MQNKLVETRRKDDQSFEDAFSGRPILDWEGIRSVCN
jgi:hypothetical protein